jgi:hypothetical protein
MFLNMQFEHNKSYDESRISIKGGLPFAICHTVHPSDHTSLSRPVCAHTCKYTLFHKAHIYFIHVIPNFT